MENKIDNNWITPGENESEDFDIPSNRAELTIDDFLCNIELEAKDKPDKKFLSKKFLDLIGQGYKPGEAAKLVGTSIKGIMSDTKVKKQLEGLAKQYRLPADVRREMVRMGLNKIFLDNLDSAEVANLKLSIEAGKAIAADTEVGINAPPQPGIQINIGALEGLFDTVAKENVIEGEVIHETNKQFPSSNTLESGGIRGTEETETEVLDAEGIRRLTERILSETNEA